ncbi:MAG: YIP1 family protein [Armatimonadota bacterium]
MHSRAKLALAVLTSPSAAFEEILERRLLGTALLIVAAAGVLACVRAYLAASVLGPVHYFALGRYNPLTWFGLFLLYALALQKLLKWVGTQTDYLRLLIVMGWAQAALVIVEALAVIGGAMAAAGTSAGMATQFIDAASAVLQIGYAALIGLGIHVASGAPTARGVMSYVVVAFAAIIGFSVTYANSRLKLFADALPGIADAAQQVAASDASAWVAASVAGLVLGLAQLGKCLGWQRGRSARLAATAGAIGAVLLGVYLHAFVKSDYYGRLIAAQRDYDLGRFERAAREIRLLIPLSKYAAPGLTLDAADVYYLLRDSELAIRYYRKFEKMVRKANLGKDEGRQLARPLAGVGAAYDLDGRYQLALEEFQAAQKAWPEFRDPWVRAAVTYNRLGDYPKAVECAEHATGKLKSRAAVAYAALAQAYAGLGDTAKARMAYRELRKIDDELAARIGTGPDQWKNAVSKLTPQDLKFPLEKEPAPPPKKPSHAPRSR